METKKIIIAGSRTFVSFELLKKVCDKLLKLYKEPNNKLEIISGCANGVDFFGEQYALRNNIPVTKFPADWKRLGKRAGYIRNDEMVRYADVLIAFWDGKSKGTLHLINLAHKYNLRVHVIRFNPNKKPASKKNFVQIIKNIFRGKNNQ